MPSNPHLILGNGANPAARRPKAWASAPTHKLTTFGTDKSVRLKISDLTDRMWQKLPDRVQDLIEIATIVYAADQSCKRLGGVTLDYGDKWYRTFRFELGVRDAAFWTRKDVQDCLTDTLSFVSEDNYEFVFSHTKMPPIPDYLDFKSGMADPEPVERVVLFSGGIDSLAGAVDEVLVHQRRVALVSHKPVNHLAKKQRELVAEIAKRAGKPQLRPVHFPVEANRIGEVEGDATQRTRSFLYAAMAGAVADYFKLKQIFFYENGIVSINLPLCAQEIGGRATRTTHPQTLDGYGRLFSMVMGTPFSVENGLLWETKEDVVRRIQNAGHADLIANTLSCSHTRQFTLPKPHCGLCSQCLSRHVAALGAGLGNYDPATGYRKDVMADPRKKADERILAERFVGVARQVEAMTQVSEFHQKFAGELGRVYPYLDMAPSLGAEKLFDLHHRHAEQVGKVMLAAMKEYAEPRRTGQLADTCVVNYAFDAGRLTAETPKEAPVESPPIVQPAAKEQDETDDEGRKHHPMKDRFTFAPGQVLFDEKDLGLPTGFAIEVFTKLHTNWGRSVPYQALEHNSPENEASDQLKGTILKIRRAIETVGAPVQIEVKPTAGYVLKDA